MGEFMMAILSRVKPNIVFAILAITTLGLIISMMGYFMGQEGIITGAGVGSIVAIANLAHKILDNEN
jgi:hypothetical protein